LILFDLKSWLRLIMGAINQSNNYLFLTKSGREATE